MKLITLSAALYFTVLTTLVARAADWTLAEKNGEQSQRMVECCTNYVRGWLAHADRRSGLLPARVWNEASAYWNAQDCAADNYPFIVLTGEITGHYYTKLAAQHILAQEQKLCNRRGVLPDDFDFATQRFRHPEVSLERLVFGASEYCKDGLMPICEQIGPSPWLDRMQQLIHGVWACAEIETPVGVIPTKVVEVNGDLMEVLGRLYWLTGDERYKEWCFRLMDYYCFHDPLLKWKRIPLRDHGCEVIAGMSEAYLIAAREDPARWQKYKPEMHALLDAILAGGINEDGLMYNWFTPPPEKRTDDSLSDGWGYVYNAFLTVALADGEERYRRPVEHVLANLHKYNDHPWLRGADDYADSIEGAVNLLNRLPAPSGFKWVDAQSEKLMAFQRGDGILEGWYGDGNSARTLLMVAMWKTQGITATPWRNELQLGAVRNDDGSVSVSLKGKKPWSGELHFDRPRHRQFLHMPVDYPRINQFPEWFTVEVGGAYEVQVEGGATSTVEGKSLLNYPVSLKENETLHLTLKAKPDKLRALRYSARSAAEAAAWQNGVRTRLAAAMKLADDQPHNGNSAVEAEVVSETKEEGYVKRMVRIKATEGRSIDALVTVPLSAGAPYPCVVCIHGHSGSRFVVHDPASIYRGFAQALAQRGAITIAIDVGSHQLRQEGHTLIGERLADLMRCVDYLESLPEADPKRIGCAGLSLGGEMAMWLGAMDTRIAATASSGFLTNMDQMEIGHCLCWKFPVLRELVDWPDVYALIAPRALLCQNGLQEPPTQFNVSLARQAFDELKVAYQDCGSPGNCELRIHPEAHVVHLESLLGFFHKHLGTIK